MRTAFEGDLALEHVVTRPHDDTRERRDTTNLGKRCEAVEHGHAKIEHDQIWLQFTSPLDCHTPIVGLAHARERVIHFEREPTDRSVARLVIHDEHSMRSCLDSTHLRSSSGRFRRGHSPRTYPVPRTAS